MNLTLLQGFNNYYNRVVKKFNTLSEYTKWATDNGKNSTTLPQINFNPNDCVDTVQVINWSNSWSPDYVIVDDGFGNLTRWFVMENQRLRGNQFQLQLRRDLLADFYNSTVNAPCFIEKATLNSNDPFIYNDEGMTFNQIKSGERQLRDGTNSAWIVGYYDYNYTPSATGDPDVGSDASTNIPGKLQVEYIDEPSYQKIVNSSLTSWEFYPYITGTANIAKEEYYFQEWNLNPREYDFESYTVMASREKGTDYLFGGDDAYAIKTQFASILGLTYNDVVLWSEVNTKSDELETWKIEEAYNDYGWSNLYNIRQNFFHSLTDAEHNQLLDLNNKIVKFIDSGGTPEYYKITLENTIDTVNSTFTDNRLAYKSFEATGSLKQALNEIQKNTGYYYGNAHNDDHYFVRIGYTSIKVKAEKISYGKYKATFPSVHYKLNDAPYGMFCLPCPNPGENIIIKNTGGSNAGGITINRDISLRVAQELGNKYAGAGVIYDIQLLPYCPCQQIITEDGVDLNNDEKLFCPITRVENDTTTTEGYILFASISSFTLNIPFNISISNNKIESQTNMYRLVSPNYNGQFEFNAAKNGGVSEFNVDCSYKPYNPYIHLNPDFGELYGADYNDARGLICNGDFSLTLINNAWETYQIQNKNYQNIFDREIQNMEIKNSVARQRDIYKGISASFTGGLTGGIAGAKGGVVGAIAGAVGGMAAGAAGSALNYKWNETLRDESIDYKRDQFGYSLGNIQALPQSITKTTSLTYNNKIFPILEYYTCKDEEKIALANKVAYNGMTVMRIGKISDFIRNTWRFVLKDNTIVSKNYIKGQVIRIEDLNCDDFHVANEIANEVFKGAFYETIN